MYGLKLKNVDNFYPLVAVDRGSETQLQVDKKLVKICII